jgi:hypothetical protein
VTFVSPDDHRALSAERDIQTAKNHIVATFATVHPTFPPDLWHLLLPCANSPSTTSVLGPHPATLAYPPGKAFTLHATISLPTPSTLLANYVSPTCGPRPARRGPNTGFDLFTSAPPSSTTAATTPLWFAS